MLAGGGHGVGSTIQALNFARSVVWGGMAEYGVDHQQLLPFWIAEVKDGKEIIVDTVKPRKA